MAKPQPRQIFIAEREHELPYSKGLSASQLMVTGLSPAASYQVANKVEEALVENGKGTVTEAELLELTLEVLTREAGDRYADALLKWQVVADLELPLIVLIGGTTGVGKSTIATQLAGRLGITRVVSTDAVREVLRSALTREMFPSLYASSFEADEAVRQPIPHSGDKLVIGFREQAAAVAVGTQALIDRAIGEGTDLILEGAHLVPGFLEGVESDRAVIVPLLLTIDDEDLHRSHFHWRSRDARPKDRYLKNFKKIRRLQKYMVASALTREVPIVAHEVLDETLAEIVDHVLAKVVDVAEAGAVVTEQSGGRLKRAAGAITKHKGERRNKREAVP